MSNLSDFLDEIGQVIGDGGTAAGVLGTAIGLLADASGAGAALTAFIAIIENGAAGAASNADISLQIGKLKDALIQELQNLGLQIAVGQVNELMSLIEDHLTQAESLVGAIPVLAEQNQLPLPILSAVDNQTTCRTALLNLIGGGPGNPVPTTLWSLAAADLKFFQPTNPWLYEGALASDLNRDPSGLAPGVSLPFFYHDDPEDIYSLKFTGEFTPPISGGSVFYYTYVLQQSLRAIYDYMAVCSVCLSTYPRDGSTTRDMIGEVNFAGSLLWYHDKIVDGIVNITPPATLALAPYVYDSNIQGIAQDRAGLSPWQIATVRGPISPHWVDFIRGNISAPQSDYARPYGALCLHTGYVANFQSDGGSASVGSYPAYEWPFQHSSWGQYPSYEWRTGFYGKYLLRCLRLKKEVYIGIGLPKVWDTVNTLRKLCGQEPVLRGTSHQYASHFGNWSLKEVFILLGAGTGNPFLLRKNVGSLAAFLMNTPPDLNVTRPPTQSGTISLRALFAT